MSELQENTLLGNIVKILYGVSPKNILDEDGESLVVGTGIETRKGNEYLIKGETIVLGRKGTIGNPSFFSGKIWIIDTAYYLIPIVEINLKYLFYFLCTCNLEALNSSTGVPSLSRSDLERIRVKFLQLNEQRKIASILSTIDSVISRTEAAIEKYKSIKQGLMQDLFTRGIDIKTGKLRPTYKQAPHLYKETKLGFIPKEWDDSFFSKYINHNMYGPRFNAKDYNENGNVKTIRGMDFTQDGEILYDQAPIALLPTNLVSAHKLNAGDVVIVTTAECGLTAVFEEQQLAFIPSAYTVKYRFNESINPYFIKYFMKTFAAISLVKKYIRQGTLGNLPGSDLLRFSIQIPKKDEQDEIVKRLDQVEIVIKREVEELNKYSKIKTGLMQVLLTGKKRVKLAEETN